ncbi:MAG TPA: hypothetical protein VLW85_04650, partial [Myxococcales bacterium]|nr:hypothetical protein [Myxococcales bacterium]
MLLRRTTPLAIAVLALACEPSVPFDTANNPSKVDYAAFDPTGSPPDIPLPNDLALLPSSIAAEQAVSPAQAALLTQWAAQGGFPNDQEVPISIDLVTVTIDPNTGAQTRSAPQLDVTSINTNNLIVLSISTAGSGPVAYDPPKASDYAVVGDHGTLTIHKTADAKNGGTRRWPAGTEIVVALRGGDSGVKITGGAAHGLQPQAAMYLLEQDKDLTLPENQSLLPGTTRADKAATGAQLEQLRKGYLLPFAAIDQAWGAGAHRQVATLGTFAVASSTKRAHVEADASGSPSGLPVPFPSDLMFDSTGHLSSDAQVAFGPLGPALATLDGFSMTAMILSGTSSPIQAGSVATGVFLFEVQPAGSNPPLKRIAEVAEIAQGKSPGYAAEPLPITEDVTTGKACTSYTSACVSTVIGLQPAVPASIPGVGVVPLPPLKPGTTYVVLVTDSVKDLNGDPLVRNTLGQILFLDPSIPVAVGGHSTVSGVSDSQAVGLDTMRVGINGAAQVLQAEKPAITRDHLIMGYTFHTQGLGSNNHGVIAAELAAMPYSFQSANITPPAGATTTVYCSPGLVNQLPGCVGTPPANTAAFAAYGIDATQVPVADIGTITDTQITTYNKLLCKSGDATCHDTGAFNPNPDPTSAFQETIDALVATPLPPYVGGCIPGPGPANGGSGSGNSPIGVCNVPLIVFHHGFQDSRSAMLRVVDRFTKAGFVVAAIDSAKHGDRTYCSADNQCAAGNTCVPDASLAGEGDAVPPGHCMNGASPGDFLRDTSCPAAHGCTNTKSTPLASGNYLISPNFFRTRDTFRQDIIDQSQLVRVLSPNPFCDKNTAPPPPAPGSANTCANQIITASTGIQIDPAAIYFVGQSLGSLEGVPDVAANPRFSAATFNVGGSTVVDLFTDPASSESANLAPLLAELGITPGSAAYLQFIQVAKWVLDPADLENFAGHVLANPLPNILVDQTGATAQSPKRALAQMALCDGTVTNTWSANLYTLMGSPFNQTFA